MEVSEIVSEFLARSPLWTEDPVAIDDLRRQVMAVNPHDPSIRAIEGLIKLSLSDGVNEHTYSEDYYRCLNSLKTKIYEHELWSVLNEQHSPKTLADLISAFEADAPRHTLEALCFVEARQSEVFTHVSPIGLDDFQLFLQHEKDFFQVLDQIPLGIGYAEKIHEALLMNFQYSRSAFVLRANTITDLLDTYNPTNAPNFGPEIGGLWHKGLRLFKHPDQVMTKQYDEWYNVAIMFAATEPQALQIHMNVWPSPSNHDDGVGQWADVIEISAAILANFWEAGAQDEIAIDLLKPIIYGLALKIIPNAMPTRDARLRRWLWGVVTSTPSTIGRVTMGISWLFGKIRRAINKLSIPTGVVLALANIITTIAMKIYELLDNVMSIIFQGLGDVVGEAYGSVIEYFYLSRAFLSGILPEARRRPKAVWALLFTNNFTRLTPGEKFALSCKAMDVPTKHPGYYAWAQERLTALKQLGVDVVTEPSIPIRGFKIPHNPTVPYDALVDEVPLLTRPVDVNQIASKFTEKLVNLGAPRGVSNMYFATPSAIVKSISRYSVDRVEGDIALKTRMKMTAHALADRYPDMYKGAKYLTPAAALNKVKVKYSPGLPFIPRYRDRKELAKHGILSAIAKEAERLLMQGTHPHTCAHCFVKDDVIGLQKLLDGKNIRTVIASDILSNVIQYCATVEATRRQPPIDSFVMNAVPRTEGGFRPFYERLQQFKYIFQADAREFDSKLGPVITVDGLSELRSLGYEGSLAQSIISSQIYASAVALRFAELIDLSTGQPIPKTGGLMTGQGNTSVDNRDSFRLMWICAWSFVTGKSPHLFWDDNVIGNAGDDDAIGTNEPEYIDDIIKFITRSFGVEVIVETVGFENLSLVGMRPIPVPPSSVQYYTVNGIPVPAFAIAGDPMALLAKRTNWRMMIAGKHDIAFLMRHLDGVIGSAYLTAHMTDIYGLMLDEYVEECTYILLRFYEKVKVELFKSELDENVGVFIHLGTERQRYKGRTSNVRLWLKNHRFPMYSDIMRIALKPQDPTTTKMRKDHLKILSWIPTVPIVERGLYGILSLREAMYSWIPNHVARSLPEFSGLDPTFVLRNHDYTIAKFTWLSLYHANKQKLPKSAAFRVVLRENPYASAEDPTGFLGWLADDRNLKELVESNLEHLRAQMVVITAIYWFIETIFATVKNVPVLSIIFNLYAFSTRDINRLYAALNYIYLIATGRSSPIISNLMPPDPYAWIKQFAVTMSALLPRRAYFYLLPGIKVVANVVPQMVDLLAGADTLMGPRPYRQLFQQLAIPDSWSHIIYETHRIIELDKPTTILVVAATGSGKSTIFPAGLFTLGSFNGTVWLLCPTIVSADEYENDFLPENFSQRLSLGVVNDNSRRLKILTYGHGRNRILKEAKPGDIIILDEIHLSEPEQFMCFYAFPELTRIGVTATPSGMYPLPFETTLHWIGAPRFNRRVVPVNMDFPSWLGMKATEDLSIFDRALIICHSLPEVNKIIQTLSRLSIVGRPLSSEFSDVPRTGTIVATNYVDTAITIMPPPNVLIDFGKVLKFNYDYSQILPVVNIEVVSTSPATAQQRLGRVGRKGDAIAYVFSGAGSGPTPGPRVTPFAILNDESLTEALLGMYRLANPLVMMDKSLPGMLKWITVSSGFDTPLSNQNDVALAHFLFIRMSDQLLGEPLYEEWLDLRIEKSPHEIVNGIVENIVQSGLGDPLLGNYHDAMALLLGGLLSVGSHGRLFPTAAIGIVDNIIVPSGVALGTIHGWQNTIFVPTTIPKLRQKFYRDISYVVNTPNDGTLIRTHGEAGHLNIVPFAFVEDNTIFTPIFWRDVASFINDEHHKLLKAPLVQSHQTIEIVIGHLAPIGKEPLQFGVVVGSYTMPLVTHKLFATRYIFPSPISDIALALVVAAGVPDQWIVVYGDIPEVLRPIVFTKQWGGLLMSEDYTWAIVNPRYIRSFTHGLLSAASLGNNIGHGYTMSIPKFVYIFSNDGPTRTLHNSETPCRVRDTRLVVVH